MEGVIDVGSIATTSRSELSHLLEPERAGTGTRSSDCGGKCQA